MKENFVAATRGRNWALIIAAFTVGCLVLAASQVNITAVAASIARIPWPNIAGAGLLMLIGALLAALRLRMIAAAIGNRLSFRDTLLALSVGQIVGVATVQFFGQIAARSALLGHRGVSASANIAIALLERLVALAVSVTLAVSGAWFLFGSVSIEQSNEGAAFVHLIISLSVAVCASAAFGWGRATINQLGNGLGPRMLVSLLGTASLTVLIQAATMLAYILIARSLAPHIPASELSAAILVVMFAASLPISFAGWGVRELSAVLALSLVGMTGSDAIAVAVVIGLLSMFAVILIAAGAVLLPESRSSITASKRPPTPINIEDLIMLVLPSGVATAVFFQIHLPVGEAQLNVNLADPVAILCAFVFGLYYVVRGSDTWRIGGLRGCILAMTAILYTAFLIGYARYGWIDWAFTNKLLGWLVLLSYGAAGALIVHRFSAAGLNILANSFAATGTTIVAGVVILLAIRNSGVDIPASILPLPVSGFSQNRNAFAFILLMGVCLSPLMSDGLRPWALGFLAAGIIMSGSRSGIATLAIVSALAWVSGAVPWQHVVKAVALSAALIGAIEASPYVVEAFVIGLNGVAYGLSMLGIDVEGVLATSARVKQAVAAAPPSWMLTSLGGSDIERMKTMFDGMALFEQFPIFGAGLGAYISTQTAPVVIIHSTPIWLLAETGFVGFSVFAVFALYLLIHEGRRMRVDPASATVTLVVISFSLMSIVHELMYQRPLWLVLGAALAMRQGTKGQWRRPA